METQTRIFLPSRRLLRVYPDGGGDSIDQAAAGAPFSVEFRAPDNWVPVEGLPLRAFTAPGFGREELLLLTVWPAERVAADGFDARWCAWSTRSPRETGRPWPCSRATRISWSTVMRPRREGFREHALWDGHSTGRGLARPSLSTGSCASAGVGNSCEA